MRSPENFAIRLAYIFPVDPDRTEALLAHVLEHGVTDVNGLWVKVDSFDPSYHLPHGIRAFRAEVIAMPLRTDQRSVGYYLDEAVWFAWTQYRLAARDVVSVSMERHPRI